MRRTGLLATLVLCATASVEAGPWSGHKQAPDGAAETPATPEVGGLIGIVSHAMYNSINTPKYKLYLYMSMGFVPKESDFVFFVSTMCNLLYVLTLLAGFTILPRGNMLVITALTFAIGPALILVMLGAAAAFIALSMFYPMAVAIALWLAFFVSTSLFQSIAIHLGLDHDGDGDVDWLDLLKWAASKPLGEWLKLDSLHRVMNQRNQATLENILHRIDKLEENLTKKAA